MVSIAEYNKVKKPHPFLAPDDMKMYRGYKEPKMYPKMSCAFGSETYTNVGTNRAVGNCKWIADRKQKPLFRDGDIRLQFPYLQGKVVDVKQKPLKMYGALEHHAGKNSSLNLTK